jgi:hypothetical protein
MNLKNIPLKALLLFQKLNRDLEAPKLLPERTLRVEEEVVKTLEILTAHQQLEETQY